MNRHKTSNMLRKATLSTLIVSFLLAYHLHAQEDVSDLPVMDYSNAQDYIIGGVRVTGVKFVDAQSLIGMSGLEIGKSISVPGDDITKIVERFWDHGLFSNVTIVAEKIEGNMIFFNIILQERSRLSKIVIEGVRKGEVKDLTEKINVKTGSQLTENVLNNIRTIITKHYKDKGFYNVSINFIQKQDTALTNRTALKIVINKREKVKIAEIDFTGNAEFKDRQLRKAMKKTKQLRHNWNIFKSKKFLENNLKEDRGKLVEFYNKKGYRDFSILGDSITFLNEKRIVLHVRLFEGEKYYFRDLSWVGNTKYLTEDLQRILGFKKGDVYDQIGLKKRLTEDEDAVSSVYHNNGYLFSSITPVELRIDNDSVDVEMRVYEGEQATIDRVVIKGNHKTNEHVVRRELRVRPGDLFSKENLMRDIRELATLGHFDPEKLQPDVQPKPQDATVDIVYQLVEKANDQLELSAGFGGGMFIGRVGVRFNNFASSRLLDLKAWRPVPSGDGQTLGISIQSNGKYYSSWNITFVEPWLGGKKRNSFSISLYHSKITNQSYYWNAEGASQYYKTTGVTVGLGKMLQWPDDWFSLQTEFTYMRYRVQDWPSTGGYYSLPFSDGISNNINVGITFGRNSQDQPIYPRRGSNVSLSLHLTPPWHLFNDINYRSAKPSEKYRWIEYHKWIFKAAWYLNLVDKLVLATNYQFGYLGYYNKEVGYSPYEGFDMGGSGMGQYQIHGIDIVPMRGYTDGALTPRVRNSENPYSKANIYTKANMELRYPVIMQPSSTIYVLGFAEAGNAWYEFKDYNPFNLKRTAGIGVRAFLPMFGLLGIDWGYGFDSVPGGGKKGEFQFILGQQF
ncbi:MAG: outer membrane protein assembly factor BamA [Bacteroidales bacterium]|jgi:outer membrane protein insertion porin family|nr:outer membrane protein assembly factor BamA [Bacteroidales bacterium]